MKDTGRKLQRTDFQQATDPVTALTALYYLKNAQYPPAPVTINIKVTLVKLILSKQHSGLL